MREGGFSEDLSPPLTCYPQENGSYPQLEYWNGHPRPALPPDLGGRLCMGGEECGGKVIKEGVEKEVGLSGAIVEMLPKGDNFSAQFCIFLKQIGDALAAVEDGRVIAPAQ